MDPTQPGCHITQPWRQQHSKHQLISFPGHEAVGRTAEKLTPRKTRPELAVRTAGSLGQRIQEHKSTETQPGAEGSPRAQKTQTRGWQRRAPAPRDATRGKEEPAGRGPGFEAPWVLPAPADCAGWGHSRAVTLLVPRKAAPALGKGGSAATLQTLREGHRDRHQKMVCRCQIHTVEQENSLSPAMQAQELWEGGGWMGRLPQTLCAAKAPIQAPNRTAPITPRRDSHPGSRGGGQRDADRHKTRESTQGPSLALSNALSQLREKK